MNKPYFRFLFPVLCIVCFALGLSSCATAKEDEMTDIIPVAVNGNYEGETTAVYEKRLCTAENSERLRKESQERARELYGNSTDPRDQIKLKLFNWWGDWVPDYEGWCKIADTLYAPGSTIVAIGGEPQIYENYRRSMRYQRDKMNMQMGPILNITVDGNVAALVYYMYLTPKGSNETRTTLITEYNTFEYVDGELMVTDLHLYSGS